jgi:diguanylate cyclase (GGDEF)-like protein
MQLDEGMRQQGMLRAVMDILAGTNEVETASGRAIVEERYYSLRRQVPIIYLLAAVNMIGMELATGGQVRPGFNLPTLVVGCGLFRIAQWFSPAGSATHQAMLARIRQTGWFAAAICLLVCVRCMQLLQSGDPASHMAVLLFGGLTAIGVAYGLTALPVAGRIPLLLIALPLAGTALVSHDRQFVWAAFSLVVVAVLTLRLLVVHNRHFVDVVRSRSSIALERELAREAHHEAMVAATTDFLTGLPNRRAFVAALEGMIEKDGGGHSFGVAILDLDRFKNINDTFGHAAGDQVLQEFAARLMKATPGHALVARLGGDEFGILLSEVQHEMDAQLVGAQILHELNGPATIDKRRIELSACCGFGISRQGEDRSPSRVLADADLALYQAKDHSSRVSVFEKGMEAPRRRRAELERVLQSPGIEDKLALVFQPIVDLASGRIIAHEALARLTDPELGEVSPAEFVPIAERLHVIGGISDHLMAKAFAEARGWAPGIRLSFNLSALQLCSGGSAQVILGALDEAGLEAGRLQVEVTETALLADLGRAKANLAELRAAGVTIVLDDFGAGFASIGYLRELRFDQIKLDGSLVTAAQFSSDGERLLRAVIGLCLVLGVETVAEHIESEELVGLVKRLGCTAGQGFWLQRPVPAERLKGLADLERRIAARTRPSGLRAA